ncbi:hypothetical protein RhiirA5_431640 [Rhizophagus irregularis]|uniref:Uncharacterized protein n=1 Tax=Rhizophagus irregularis TaxID=588596 RepID=A0A2I1GTA5_9GLOM|nr:hypothetical protein RhiirA5_431640 [Rhizophagus irregularis]PKC63691.1 hypothetical protein RhiirA1_463416 [Rhizophagus irregularis]PKY26358.1 hypothetical protein RhiirB3_441634 [Rhizophagus irregularis]PKY45699.1 hypothetical protein RhiirA4_460344 [Rhizophagus irregularis]PKY49870.1 hypothetical protein RhiirA4_466016 [Rhizophagus irregularis]
MEDDLGAGLQIIKRDEIIDKNDKNGTFKTRRTQSSMSQKTSNKNFDLNDKVEEFNKLNEIFSERVKDISDKAEGSKGKDKEIVINGVT